MIPMDIIHEFQVCFPWSVKHISIHVFVEQQAQRMLRNIDMQGFKYSLAWLTGKIYCICAGKFFSSTMEDEVGCNRLQ